jgi:uncharacterized protein YfkK (UPF0435 family)
MDDETRAELAALYRYLQQRESAMQAEWQQLASRIDNLRNI